VRPLRVEALVDAVPVVHARRGLVNDRFPRVDDRLTPHTILEVLHLLVKRELLPRRAQNRRVGVVEERVALLHFVVEPEHGEQVALVVRVGERQRLLATVDAGDLRVDERCHQIAEPVRAGRYAMRRQTHENFAARRPNADVQRLTRAELCD